MSLALYTMSKQTHTAVKWLTVWIDGLYALKALSLAPSLILFSPTSISDSPSIFIQGETRPFKG